jgi:hypothetical protein
LYSSVAVTTVPFLIKIAICSPPPLRNKQNRK